MTAILNTFTHPAATLAIPSHNAVLHTGYGNGHTLDYNFYVKGALLFEGTGFRPSPMHGTESMGSLLSLLSFLTVQPGDADPRYFDGYTADQLDWADSHECEALKGLVLDAEDADSEYHKEALGACKYSV